MKFPSTSGTAIVLDEYGNTRQVTYSPLPYNSFKVGEHEVEYFDAYDSYALMSDDGSHFYYSFCVVDSMDATLPPIDEMRVNAPHAIDPVMKATYVDNIIHTDDYRHVMIYLTSPVFMYHRWMKNGKNVKAAQEEFVKDFMKKSNI